MAIFNNQNNNNLVKACDYSKKIKSLSSGVSWTANKDCWIVGNVISSYGNPASLSIDGVNIMYISSNEQSGNHYHTVGGIFVKKGSTILMTAEVSGTTLNVYACLP